MVDNFGCGGSTVDRSRTGGPDDPLRERRVWRWWWQRHHPQTRLHPSLLELLFRRTADMVYS